MPLASQRRLFVPLVAAALAQEVVDDCTDAFYPPDTQPLGNVTVHNGVALKDVCITHAAPYHVFVIGDWGGTGDPPSPAENRQLHEGDTDVQQRVADQMNQLALNNATLDYVLNVGDSFYWGGIERSCLETLDWSPQWSSVFNNVYNGPALQGKPWLGVLGNHDYGGWRYSSGWGQIIAMTWVDSRWRIPAQYWSSRVRYPDFSVDYYFVDSNHFSCSSPESNPKHNMCSSEHNGAGDDCAEMGGPDSSDSCPSYFGDLWHQQEAWLSEQLALSTATWRIVVTHIPPQHGPWKDIAEKFGIDLVVCGHVHYQRLYRQSDAGNPIAPTGLIVSGGGGGITAENIPDVEGHDDQYGFVDLELSKDRIGVRMLSHGGQLRGETDIEHCYEGSAGHMKAICKVDRSHHADDGGDSTTTESASVTTHTSTSTTTTEEPNLFKSTFDRIKALVGLSELVHTPLLEDGEAHLGAFGVCLFVSAAALGLVVVSMLGWARRRPRRHGYPYAPFGLGHSLADAASASQCPERSDPRWH
mmetsp:Transcript_112741/g.319752  ORF Transcript_112741/g.319752 Transcript_112741/m.319752 type:complete len:528 (-) Transcript_112741:74-1657(-)